MRLMITVFVLVALIVVDQFRFHGYYGSQISQFLVRIIHSVT